MTAQRGEDTANPDFLRMEGASRTGIKPGPSKGEWLGWPTKVLRPRTLTDGQDRVTRVWAPVMEVRVIP